MCFKCNQLRHRSHQYPRRQTINLIEAESMEKEVDGLSGTISEDPFHYKEEDVVDTETRRAHTDRDTISFRLLHNQTKGL